jgi:hypothetical protein
VLKSEQESAWEHFFHNETCEPREKTEKGKKAWRNVGLLSHISCVSL